MSEAAITVAGHLCIDIAPDLSGRSGDPAEWIRPGELVNVGGAQISAGGCVANTALALHRLGAAVRPLGKVGNDIFGEAIRGYFNAQQNGLGDWLQVAEGEASSYTLVFNPPDVDRMFFHCGGVNDTFRLEDVQRVLDDIPESKSGRPIFHFGYPPLMRSMWQNGGTELERLIGYAQQRGYRVSLDTAWPDPGSEVGRISWRALLERNLKHVDAFLPSLDELLVMLYPHEHESLRRRAEGEPVAGGGSAGGSGSAGGDASIISRAAEEVLAMGPALVAIKLGPAGYYLRTSTERGRLERAGFSGGRLKEWSGREFLVSNYAVEARATTGAGDSSIAGFLCGWNRGWDPVRTVRFAVATGAHSVEGPDAISHIPSALQIEKRQQGGWLQRTPAVNVDGWQAAEKPGMEPGVWFGPADRESRANESDSRA